MLDKSTIQKKRIEALNATTLNYSLVSSICFSAIAEILFYSSISVEILLDSARISMRTSSLKSAIVSGAADNVNRILFSSS